MPCPTCKQVEMTRKEQLKNLVRVGGNSIKAYVQGKPVRSSREMVMKRIAICRNCPDNKYDSENDMCQVCGCKISRRNGAMPPAAAVAAKECPLGHW